MGAQKGETANGLHSNRFARNYASSVSSLAMIFVELPIFVRCAADLFTDADLLRIQLILMENPAAGDLMPGGRGLRKLRVPLPGCGKRGGARLIYYHWVSRSQCYLVYAYTKHAAENLTSDQLARLAALMDAEVQNG